MAAVNDVPQLVDKKGNPKTLQPKNKGLVTEIFDWDEEEVFNDEEVTQVKVLMALADDDLTIGKSHARNGEWVDITIRKCRDELLSLKQAKLDAVTFQIQNTKLTKLNHALHEQLKREKKIYEKWLTSSRKLVNTLVRYDQEMVPKTKDRVERLNPDSKPPNFNPGRILIPESQAVNESIETLNIPESSKDSKAEFLISLPPLKNLQGPSSSSEILKAKAKPFPPCTHYGFNDHRPDDCRNYPECEICRSYDHSISKHNHVIHIRRGVLVESSQSSESLIRVKCYTCGSTVHSTSDHNEFDHFKREKPGHKVVFGDSSSCITEGCGSIKCGGIVFTKVAFVNGLKYNLISISQLCDAKYIVQFDDKQGTIFNANKEIILIAPRRNDVYVLDMSSLTPNGACFFAKTSESIKWLWHKRLSHLNFKNINKLSKQNKVLDLPSLVYSKDKPYTTCEKRKHHKASFKTKQNFSIKKCLHLLHMDLFRPDIEDPHDLINTEGTHEQNDQDDQNVQDDQMITQPIDVSSGNNIEVLRPITEPLVPDVTQSHIPNQASISSYPTPQDRWPRDQHIELVNIISNPREGILTRSMATKLTAASTSECLFADFLSEIEPKKVKIAIGSKWVFRNKKDEYGTTTKNKARPITQGYSQEEGIDYDETFAPVARMEAIRIFLAFATYMNFKVYQMDVKSAFLNGKLKEEVYVKQPIGFESSEFPDYVCKLDKALLWTKTTPKECSLVKTPMVSPNNLGLDLAVQSKRITSNSCEKNTQSAKKHQSAAMSSAKANMLLLLGVVQEKHEEAAVHYVNLKASIDDYYNENIAHKDQTDQMVEASMSSFEKSRSTINDLYKGLEVITQLLKDITNSIKNNPATNKKIEEAFETLAKISTQTAKILWETNANIYNKPEEPKKSTDANIFIGSSIHLPSITRAQPIIIIHPEPSVPQREGKEIQEYWDKEEEIKKVEEEARLNAISKTESDINKVGMEALVSYLVAASMVKSPENARFSMKLRKLIVEQLNQEKLKSKKVKLEALGYTMN
nr:retrovirus-related Pol polyprotein from transposon TNT 1-94 [Tanacetum cinerariifolium]